MVIVDLDPRFLSWDEVDPSRHPFDRSSAARAVDSLGPARRVPRRPEVSFGDRAMSSWNHGEGTRWADAMSHALAERFGRWSLGWRWAHDEGDFDGGPVGSWCCPQHSITTPQETLARVVAGLCEWRAWLESLAGWFEAYLGGRWHTFDPRNNEPRIGRVLIAQGRDAADVPITQTFGDNTLVSFKVWTDEVE